MRQPYSVDWNALGIDPGQDFHTLTGQQVDALLAEAERLRYRKPKHAFGSRARYFHARLQREYQKTGKDRK